MTAPTFGSRCWAALCGKWPALSVLDATTARLTIEGSLEAHQEATGQDRNGIPPSLPEVQDYVRKIKSPVDPIEFVEFYNMREWAVGKFRMKDWQAAVRLWTRRHDKPQIRNGSASLFALQAQLKTIENEMEAIMYPGGSQFKLLPTGEKAVRFNRLAEQRKSLREKIDSFAS